MSDKRPNPEFIRDVSPVDVAVLLTVGWLVEWPFAWTDRARAAWRSTGRAWEPFMDLAHRTLPL